MTTTTLPIPPPRLRDRLRPGIRALFVGINPGMRSAAIGHHFAGFSNRFWKLLFESGLVPRPLRAEDDDLLPGLGYGITNLVSRATPGIGDLSAAEYEAGRRRLVAKVRRCRPQLVALVGVTLYRALFETARGGPAAEVVAGSAPGRAGTRVRQFRKPPLPDPLGLRAESLGGVRVFVLPNPSGRNANYGYAEMLESFRALKQALERMPGAERRSG